MAEIFIVTLVILFVVQVFTFLKVMRIIKQVSKLLLEVRILFKNSGIYYQPKNEQVIKSNTCQYCRNRMSFIQNTDESDLNSFYYVCKKNDIQVSLSDSCQQFERDFQSI